MCIGSVHWVWGALTPLTPSPPPSPPPPARRVPPPQHLAETRYRDSSGLSVRNRSPGGWGGGWRESRARPSFPVSIRYTRDGLAIRVKDSINKTCWKMVKICWTGLLKFFLADFQILGPLGCQGRVVIPQNGPKWHSPIGSMPFHRAQKTREFQGPTPSNFPT